MSKYLLRLVVFAAPLLLTACGEGWEAQRSDSYFPYGNQRTAGSGVVYVRAKMLPEKKLVVEPVANEVKEDSITVEPVLEAEEIFSDAQRKGSAPVKKDDLVSKEEKHGDASSVDKKKEEHANAIITKVGGAMETTVSEVEPASGVVDTSAEDYISMAPKRIIAKKVEVIKSPDIQKGSYEFEGEEMVEVFENEVIQPQKEIVVPKKDKVTFLSLGEEALNEIYSSDF